MGHSEYLSPKPEARRLVLRLRPTSARVTSIDAEHLEY